MRGFVSNNKALSVPDDVVRHPKDDRVVYANSSQTEILVPLIRAGFIDAAIIKETPSKKKLREAFTSNLTLADWTNIDYYMPKMRILHGGKGHSYQFNLVSLQKTQMSQITCSGRYAKI